jgi:chemotaxis protein MotC
MAIDHRTIVKQEDVDEVVTLMDAKRQREIYLRLARRAAISGNRPLATFASAKARHLSSAKDVSQLALADLYSGLVNIPTDGVDGVLERLSAIPDKELTPKDRFLKDAARVVAEEVSRPPPEFSLTQVRRDMLSKEYRDEMADRMLHPAPSTTPGQATAGKPADTEALQNFVSQGRSRIKEIDAMLTSESQ